MVLDDSEVKGFRASGKFETVYESEVRLVRRLYVCEVGVVDRAKSNSETVQLVMGQDLLVKVVVTGSVAVLILMVLGDALLLILHRGMLRAVLRH